MNEHAFYLDPEFWVAASFVLFFIIATKPILRSLNKMLDARSLMIEQELAEAKKLREEAEEVLASYKKRQQESLNESETLIATATKEANAIAKQAEAQAAQVLDKRMKLALEKIAQAENKAMQEVQEHIADIAVSVARALMIEHVKRTGDMEIVKQAASELERKLH